MFPPTSSVRNRVAGLRLPADLPPRDLERLTAAPPSSTTTLPAPASAPASFGLAGAPSGVTKFGGEGSPADVRVYTPNAPLLMRGGVVSPGHGGGSGLILPTLSLPLSGPTNATNVPIPLTQPLSAPAPEATHSPVTGVSQHHVQPLPLPPPPTSHIHSSSPMLPSSLPRAQTQPLVHRPPSLVPPPRSAGLGPMASSTQLTMSQPAPQLSQNEIKKAQNRKSAKRFREAQKLRWKNMADDLLVQKRTISELRAQIAGQEACVARANAVIEGAASLPVGDARRSAMSINDLVDADLPVTSPLTPPPNHAHVEAEAALYAQILSNTAQRAAQEAATQPYVSEIGLLTLSYVVISHSTKVVSIRRGSRSSFGTFAIDGLSNADAAEFRSALTCGNPVAVAYSRHGVRVNAVMHPVENSDRVVVAEFSPFH